MNQAPQISIDYSHRILPDADFRGRDLQGAKFRFAYLHKADFRDANLRNATFIGSDLREARFDGADLAFTDFTGADFRGSSIDGVKPTMMPLRAVKKYVVKLDRFITEVATVEVVATSKEEAKKIALLMDEDGELDWNEDDIEDPGIIFVQEA